MSGFLEPGFWVFVGVTAGIFAVFALGLQVQFGQAGVLNFGHVAFMAVAAYVTAILVIDHDVSLWLGSGIGIGAAAAVGTLVALPTVRLRADYLAIATIAFGEIVRHVALNESALTGGPQGTINIPASGAGSYNGQWQEFLARVEDVLAPVFGADLADRQFAMLVVVWAVVLILLPPLTYVMRSPWGRVLKAIREDEDAAVALGKNVFRFKVQAVALGAGIGGLAGVLYAFHFSFFSPFDFDPLVTFFAYIIVILAGAGSYWGVPVGALVFGVLFAGTRFLDFWPLSEMESAERAWLRLVIIGVLLILLVAFRPQGLFGKREEMVLE